MSPRDVPPPYDLVAFDCDSTLSAIEGIDELALAAGPVCGAQIAALTNRAMAGELRLEEVYSRRLAILRPSAAAVAAVAERYAATAVAHAGELVRALRAVGKRVIVLSGGLRPAVLPFARGLGIGAADVFAVDVHFDERGDYLGFAQDSPLARSGGKPEVLAALPGRRVLVGDGASDLEAAAVIERFVAFGGVVRREAVFAASAVRCAAPDLAALLPSLLSEREIAALAAAPEHAALLAAARRFARS